MFCEKSSRVTRKLLQQLHLKVVKHTLKSFVKLSLKIVSWLTCFSYHIKICYGGDVPVFYYCKENVKADSLKEESYQVGCVKRGTALKLNFEVDSPGSVLRYALHENEPY